MSESTKPRPFETFYNALPYRKAELVDGKFIVGGSIEKSAMTLRYLLDGKLVFGGSPKMTKEWVGLLVMTLGVGWCVGQ